MQIEAAFGIIFFPFVFLFFALKNKKIKELAFLTSGFFATLLPQALFELRHNFIMTKVLISEFTGKVAVLGEKMSLNQRFPSRWDLLLDQIRNLSHIPEKFLNIIFLLCVISVGCLIINQTKKSIAKDISIASLSFLIFASLFYLAFSQPLKQWYVLGLSIPLTLVVAIALDYFWNTKNKIAMLLVSVILFFHLTNALVAQAEYITNYALKPSNDPSNLRNQLATLDWVYQQANGKDFKAYNYVPSVYDYSYHYLYWWYGTKTFGYQPADVAYLPNQPEYIKDTEIFWTKKKPVSDNQLTFLIIEKDKEMPEREQAWLGNFSKLCTVVNNSFKMCMEIV